MRKFLFFGPKKKYPSLSWWTNFMGGHLYFWGITIYGANAMNWAATIDTRRWGRICFSLPALSRFTRDRYTKKLYYDWYIYLSPNSTPWASTFYRGRNKSEVIRAQIRKLNFGHDFDSEKRGDELSTLNEKFSYLFITEFDIEKHLDYQKNHL